MYASVYGKWEVSQKYHSALHILLDLISDYGPPQVYWCFAYERMNGILSEIPNNSKNVELQIIHRIIEQCSIDITAVSQDPSFDEKSFPRALKQLVSPTVMCHSHYSVMDHFNAHHALVEPTEAVFDYYRRIDNGEGIDDD